MSYSDPTKLFSVLKQRAQTQSSGGFGNSNLLKFKKNTAYAFRLLWLPSDVSEYPMINQYVHRIWDNNAVGSKDVSVICPTSQYDKDGAGFNECPICSEMSKLYREATNNRSASAKELYSKFKRQLRGYVPVYVVNGPDEDINKVKILQYTISFKRFFDEKIFGIMPTKNGQNEGAANTFNEEECVGLNAFMYFDPKKNDVIKTGYNFTVTVATKKIDINGVTTEVHDYKLDFSRRQTTIDDFDGVEITPEYFKGLAEQIHFYDDFYKMSDIDAINKFKLKYIDGVENLEDVPLAEETASKPVSVKKVVAEDEPPFDEEETCPEPVKKAAVKKAVEDDEDFMDDDSSASSAPVKKSAPAKKAEEAEEKTEEKDDDDIDLDALLAGL